MASTFPGAIDNFTDPLSNSSLSSPSHAGQHSDLNDAVEKIETYMGLVKVIPTGATNGTVGATGTVTIGNAVSSVTVSGAFSALYDSYRIVLAGIVASSSSPNCQFQLSGITTNVYYAAGNYYSWANTTINNYSPVAANYVVLGTIGTEGNGLTFDLHNPFLTRNKFGYSHSADASFGFQAAHRIASSASATGFTLSTASGTWTGGTIRVYGYRN